MAGVLNTYNQHKLVVTTDIFNFKLPGRGEYGFCRGTKGVVEALGAVEVPDQKNHALL
jgi:hypothetical protein